MFDAAPTLDPIDAALTKAGRWFRGIGAAVHAGLKALKGLTRGAKPGKIAADGSATEARREARTADIRQRVIEVIDREAIDANHHDSLVAALDTRLAFNLAYVDIDILPLRERVKRLCADLRLVPERGLWTAGDFSWDSHATDRPAASDRRTTEKRPLDHRRRPYRLSA